jgi:orotate phosphoribosyltransferase
MSHFSREEFLNFIVENGVVGFFDEPVTLSSGRTSHWYANWRTVVSDAYLTDELAGFLIAYLMDKDIPFDTIYGVPDGATKLGVIAQLKWAQKQQGFGKGSHTLLMGRGKPKEHGVAKDRFFLGDPTGRIVVIEDVTTTGGSLIKAIGALKEAGANVVGAVGLTNRLEKRDDGVGVADAVGALGVEYHDMSTACELLPRLAAKLQLSDETKKAVEKECEENSLNDIKLP